MHVVAGLKEHVAKVGTDVAGANGGRELVGGIVSEEALWDCVTCGACEQECPVGVEHLERIVDMRRHLVMERASMPDTAMNALVNMEQRGHPWRGTTYGRTDWADGLGVPTLAEHPNAEVLLWVGCTAALEQRSQGIARAMASVLKRAGVDFAILGDEESCTGDPARRMGNEYLYQTMAQRNVELLNGYDVKRIVTLCPHCFNAIKNEYPHLGGSYRVQHYSELVSELIADGGSGLRRPSRRPWPTTTRATWGATTACTTPAADYGGDTGRASRGGGAMPRARLLLRRRRRPHVDGGEQGRPNQPRPR